MSEKEEYFRVLHLSVGPSTDGVPDNLLSTVIMFRRAFPEGIFLDSAEYCALCEFLYHENWPHRAVASALDFSFNLGYVTVLNSLGHITDAELRASEMLRIEQLLQPLGLESWRHEEE